jgi:hypothetical protein
VFELYKLSAEDIALVLGNPLTFAAVAVAEPTTVS